MRGAGARHLVLAADERSAYATRSSVSGATRAALRSSSPTGVRSTSITASNHASADHQAGSSAYAPVGAGSDHEPRRSRDTRSALALDLWR